MKKLIWTITLISLTLSGFSQLLITTIAGTGVGGYTGDGGNAVAATLNFPVKVAADRNGNVFISDDGNNAIRKINSAGVITTIAGTGVAGYSGDGGPANLASINGPWGIGVDLAGNLYFSDVGNNVIRRVDATTNIITTVAGNGVAGYSGDGGPALLASFNGITGLAVDVSNNIYVTDDNNNRVRKIDGSTGIVVTLAGTGTSGYSGDGGAAIEATLQFPVGISVDINGGIYLTDSDNQRIRKINSSGIITTIAGNGSPGYNGDGILATSATLYNPWDAVADASGNVFIADFFNCRIRKVDGSTGIISTYAGSSCGYGGDGGPATSGQMNAPTGLCFDSQGNLIIVDAYSNRIRKVAPPPTIVFDQFVVDSTYAQLDTSLIPSGILGNRIAKIPRFTQFEGSTAISSSMAEMNQMIFSIFNNRVKKIKAPDIFSVQRKALEVRDNLGATPIVILNYNYQYFKDNAITDGLIVQKNQIYYDSLDVIDTINPYNTSRLFNAVSFVNNVGQKDMRFYIGQDFYFSNDHVGPSGIKIDFGDGSGFRTVHFGQIIDVHYTDLTAKVINVEVTLGSSVLKGASAMLSNWCVGSNNTPNFDINLSHISSTFSYPGQAAAPAVGNVYAFLGNNNPTKGTSNPTILKPVIFVEGVDFGYDDFYDRQGEFGWCQLWGDDQTNYPEMKFMPNLLNTLHQDNFDIVMLDFHDGAYDIPANGMLLVTVLDYLQKQSGLSTTNKYEPAIVVGASMGGQVSKYALSYMEQQGIKHCATQYVSFDSPQQGANIPIGLQYMLDLFGTKSTDLLAASFQSQLGNKLNRIAAKQLLNVHYTDQNYQQNGYSGFSPNDATYLHGAFYSQMQTLGYPKYVRNVAIANGSRTRTNQGYNKGAQVINWLWNPVTCLGVSVLIQANVNAIGVPGNNVFSGKTPHSIAAALSCVGILGPIGCVTCFTNLGFGTGTYSNASANGYDNCPGGYRPSFKDAVQQINDELISSYPLIAASHLANLDHPNHAFIPAVSALDINTLDLFFDIAGNMPTFQKSYPGLTPFEAYFAPSVNQQHVFAQPGPGGNIEFGIDQIRRNYPLQPSQLPTILSSGQPANYFNAARQESRLIKSVTINNHGSLYVNGFFDSDFGGLTPPPYNAYVLPPDINSLLKAETCDCDNVAVEVKSGGQFILGDVAPTFAEVYFHSGSQVIVRNGGTLLVNSGSKLIIEPGAKLTIEAGSNIIIQDDAQIIIQNGGTIQINLGSVITLQGPKALLDVQDVNTHLTLINSAAKLTFTGGTSANGGLARFAGGTFTHSNGATLLIDNATVLFDYAPPTQSGGQPVQMRYNYFSKAKLQLINHGILDLRGDLHIKKIIGTPVDFTFSWQGTTTQHGFIRFSRQGWWGGSSVPHIIADPGATITFNGLNRTDTTLSVSQETVYILDPNISKTTFNKGMVIFYGADAARLEITTPYDITKTTFRGFGRANVGGYQQERGLELYTNPQSGPLTDCDFVSLGTGLSLPLIFNNTNYTVNNCRFYNCGNGISAWGGGLQVINCIFNGDEQSGPYFPTKLGVPGVPGFRPGIYGVNANGLTINSNFVNCTATYQALASINSSPITCFFNKCTVKDAGLDNIPIGPVSEGISVYQSNVSLLCCTFNNISSSYNTFNYSSSGVTYNAGIKVLNNGLLDMSTAHFGGHNNFYKCAQTSIYLEDAFAPQLTFGYNNLMADYIDLNQCYVTSSNQGYYYAEIFNYIATNYTGCPTDIYGTINLPPGTCPQGSPPPYHVSATHNYWRKQQFIGNGGTLQGGIDNMNSVQATCHNSGDVSVTFQDPNEASARFTNPMCNNPNPSSGTGLIVQNCPNCSFINTQSLGTAKTNDVANTAALKMDATISNGYRDAVALFHQLHIAVNSNPSSGDVEVYSLSRRKMHEAYSLALSTGQLPYSNASCAYLNKVLQVLDSSIKSVPDTVGRNYAVKFYGHLEKAETYRMAKLYPQALAEFNNALNIGKTKDRDYVQRWICLAQTEKQVFDGQLSISDFRVQMDICSPPIPFSNTANNRLTHREIASENNGEDAKIDGLLSAFRVFPNPADKQLNVSYTFTDGNNGTFEILDVSGKLVFSEVLPFEEHAKTFKIDLVPGVYMYRIICNNQVSKTDKLVLIQQ